MKLSDYIAERVAKETDVVFGYQGSSISHVIDSFCRRGITYIQSNHEQASAFNACGYAERSNKLGIVVACSGPGATNLLTGIANAYYDSLPVLFIVGQVSTKELKINNSRQNGFQQTNIVEITKPITKYSVEIYNPEAIFEELDKCIFLSNSGRRGPTLISIPHNIQSADIDPVQGNTNKTTIINDNCNYQLISDLVSDSKRPLILIGGGFLDLKESSEVKELFKSYKIPVVSSLRGLNNIPECNYIGMVGIYGNREANLSVYKCDLLIVLGSRLDARQTGGNPHNFAPSAKIIQVDSDINEINREIKVDYPIVSTCRQFIANLLAINDGKCHIYEEWEPTIRRIKQLSSDSLRQLPFQYQVLNRLFTLTETENLTVSTDVGQNQMWVAQSFHPGLDKYFLTSGGHGSMGYAIPSIIGAYFASVSETMLMAFTGDGGFQMNIQELGTISKLDIAVCIVVFNNNGLGLIRDYQDKALNDREYGSVIGFSNPNFSYLAKAYDFDYMLINERNYTEISIKDIKGKRTIIEVQIEQKSRVIPEIAYMQPIYNQYPLININDLEE